MHESEVHQAFSRWLVKNRLPFLHSRTDKRTTTALGWPDYCVFSNSKVVFVEFKVGKNKCSPAQIRRFAELEQAGCLVFVARSLVDAIGHIETEFGQNEATAHPAQPNEPSGGQPEPKFWLAHSNALGEMVVTKDQIGKWCGIRVATAEDKARFPRLPAGMME